MMIDGPTIILSQTDVYIIIASMMAGIWWVASRIPDDENKLDNAGGKVL